MSRGLGTVQRAVLAAVGAEPDGVAADKLANSVFGQRPTAAQYESVRRAIRTLEMRGLVERTARWESRPRKSLKRLVDLAPCEPTFCDSCAQRKRRVRLQDWHRRAMRANAKHDPAWLGDLTIAEASGFVHVTGSSERLIDSKPNAVDPCERRVQFVIASRPL